MPIAYSPGRDVPAQLRAFIAREGLLEPDDHLLLTVSGGRDSMALLSLMHELGDWPLAVAHCNFQLRGQDSDLDQELVAQTCQVLGVTCHSIRFDTLAWARAHGLSTQEACRELRYQYFEHLAQEHGYTKIATAHHLQDQAETVLFNLFRGAGLAGIRGIPPRNGRVVRPLLALSRADLEAWIQEKGLAFRDDRTNFTEVYRRNFIRLRILPLAVDVNPHADSHLAQAADHAREALHTLDHEAQLRFGPVDARPNSDVELPLEAVAHGQHTGLARHWLRMQLAARGFSPGQIAEVNDLLLGSSQTGRFVENVDWRAILDRGMVRVVRRKGFTPDPLEVLHEPGRGQYLEILPVDCVGWGYDFIRRPAGEVVLDMDKVSFPLVLRRWRPGDSLRPLGLGGRKKVSDLLTDRKVPSSRRPEVHVMESGGRLAWVVGVEISEEFALTPESTRALVCRVRS